jgi:hypothetical protein
VIVAVILTFLLKETGPGGRGSSTGLSQEVQA